MCKNTFELAFSCSLKAHKAAAVKTFEAEFFSVKIGGTTLIASYRKLIAFYGIFFIFTRRRDL
ncbi:hypothetical protein C7H83_02340 [Tetragenococcus halophilus]|uniref:Uncharacterized protein n=1 Tax=Tetragenococcus halophilus TaxID=51669 RepID=A0A3G5FGP6_TETHA|nr:hypothetical protein AC806_00515 [Tetragenococcus halophilus]AYW49405.1 hypothetical protein C7H83_02340 [Tetragenococcus halophilus]